MSIYSRKTLKLMGMSSVKEVESPMAYFKNQATMVQEGIDAMLPAVDGKAAKSVKNMRSEIAALTRVAVANKDERLKELTNKLQASAGQILDGLSTAQMHYWSEFESVWKDIQTIIKADNNNL